MTTPQEAYDSVIRAAYPAGPPTGQNPADRDRLTEVILQANAAFELVEAEDRLAKLIDDHAAGILTSDGAHAMLEALLRGNGWQANVQTTRLSRLIMRLDLRDGWPLHRVCMTAYLTGGCRFGHEWRNTGDSIDVLAVPVKMRGHS